MLPAGGDSMKIFIMQEKTPMWLRVFFVLFALVMIFTLVLIVGT